MEGIWSLAVIGGPLLLGIALAYGIFRYRQRSPKEIERSERGAKENYGKAKKV